MKNILGLLLGLLFGSGCILLVSCNGTDVETVSEAPVPMVETPALAEETPAFVEETPAIEEETLVVETPVVEETYAEEPVIEVESSEHDEYDGHTHETEVDETLEPVVEEEVTQ